MAIDKQKGIRLETFINSLNIKHKLFAERVGTSNKFVSQIINGHNNLTTDMAYRIGKSYPQLNKEWLLHGEGEMLIDEKGAALDAVSEPTVEYGKEVEDPFEAVKKILKDHERRLKALEEKGRSET